VCQFHLSIRTLARASGRRRAFNYADAVRRCFVIKTLSLHNHLSPPVLRDIRIEVEASVSSHCSSSYLFALLRTSGTSSHFFARLARLRTSSHVWHVFALLRTSFLHIISITYNHALLDPHCIHAPPLSTRPTYSIRHRLRNESIRRRVQLSEVYSRKHGIDSNAASKNPTDGVGAAGLGQARGHQSNRTYPR